MSQAQIARYRRHLQAPRRLAKFRASRIARAVSFRPNLNPEVSLDRTAEARHIDVRVKAAGKRHADVAAHRVEFHVVGTIESIDFDFDIATDRRSAHGTGYVGNVNIATDCGSVQAARNPGNPDIAADRRDMIEVVVHRTRYLYLKANTRIAVAVLRIMNPNIDIACPTSVFDLNLIAISPLLSALNDDHIPVVGGHYHVT